MLPASVRAFISPLVEEFGEAALAVNEPATLLAAVERADALAKEGGLNDPDERRAVLRCMVLIGSDLSRAAGPDADIRLTLGMTERAAEQRVRRITRIAQTVADDEGGAKGLSTLQSKRAPSTTEAGPAPALSPSSSPTTAAPAPDATAGTTASDATTAPSEAPSERAHRSDEPPATTPARTADPAPVTPTPAPPPVEPTQEDFGFRDHPPPPRETETAAPGPTGGFADLASDPALAPPGARRSENKSIDEAPRASVPSPATPPTAGPGAAPTDESGSADSVPGYDAIRGAVAIATPAQDATTSQRVLISIANGDADAALARLATASAIVHRNLEKIIDTVQGTRRDTDHAYLVTNDEELATLHALRPRLHGLASADADAVSKAFLLTEGALAPHLAQVVAEKQRVHERLVLNWAADLADALQAAHHEGLAHGGIDDSMVMLDRHGVPLLRGLGLSDPADPSLDALSSEQLKSIAPERIAAAADGEPIRPEHAPGADIWSLGALVYTLLGGRPPYEGHRSALLRDIATREPTPLGQIAEGISDDAADACAAALTRDPASRPQSMQAYAELLREAASSDGKGKRKLGLFGRK